MSNSENIKGYITLQQIVMDFLSDKGIFDSENYIRYLKWAARGFEKLGMYDLDSVQVEFLTINDNGVAVLPEDYIDYTKIGLIDDDGTIINLGVNEDIVYNRASECGNPLNDYFDSSNDTDVLDGYYYVPYYDDSCGYKTLYGLSGGFAEGYYRVDKAMRQIQFNSIVPQQTVVLEYISSGVKARGNTFISREAKEPIIAFMHWKDKQHNGGTINEVAQAKQFFDEERKEVRDFILLPTAQELQDVLYSGYKQTLKR